MRPHPQLIRLIHQQIDPLPPLQHPLDILRHDAPHILNLPLHAPQRVLLVRPEIHHQLLQRAVERRRAIRRETREIRLLGFVPAEELVLDLDEVGEGDAAAEGGGGDDEIGEAAGGEAVRVLGGRVGDVVDVVLVVGVGELLGFGVVDFGEDEGGEGGGVRGGGGGMFAEDGGAVGDAGAGGGRG